MQLYRVILIGLLLVTSPLYAQEFDIDIYHVDENGIGAAIGSVTISSGIFGVVLTPNLSGLSPGLHGFYLHENPSCDEMEEGVKTVPALAAGGHYDPENTNTHLGPYAQSHLHLGDLPYLYVDKEGNATLPLLATSLKLSDFKGRSLMIHAGGDYYSDEPAKLGGGGPRIACGVIQ